MERVRREVEGRLGPEALGRGGLRIYTTLSRAPARGCRDIGRGPLRARRPFRGCGRRRAPGGAIRALAGQAEGFNLPLDARRQPGAPSPIVLAAALKRTSRPRASTSPTSSTSAS